MSVKAGELVSLATELQSLRSFIGDAARDVLAERYRQINTEGWTPAHDDTHCERELAGAAAAYCHSAQRPTLYARRPNCAYAIPPGWPKTWADGWWKPKNSREDLVRAGALILAEIERLDRTAPQKEQR